MAVGGRYERQPAVSRGVKRAPEKPKPNGVKARLLARGLDVLFALSRSPDGARLGDLGAQTKLPVATVLRILRTFMDRDIVTIDPSDKRYFLGPALLQLSAVALKNNNIAYLGQPLLNSLRDRTLETACLFERHGHERHCAASAISNQDLGFRIEPGQRRPLLAGSAGRVLISHLSSEELAPLAAGLSSSERAAVQKEAGHVRKAGFIITQDEIVMGATAISAPVFDATGSVVASLSVLGPTVRLSREKTARYAPWVRQAAQQLSTLLGAQA
jgi:IclR family acetate operon transcriptional repressor